MRYSSRVRKWWWKGRKGEPKVEIDPSSSPLSIPPTSDDLVYVVACPVKFRSRRTLPPRCWVLGIYRRGLTGSFFAPTTFPLGCFFPFFRSPTSSVPFSLFFKFLLLPFYSFLPPSTRIPLPHGLPTLVTFPKFCFVITCEVANH